MTKTEMIYWCHPAYLVRGWHEEVVTYNIRGQAPDQKTSIFCSKIGTGYIKACCECTLVQEMIRKRSPLLFALGNIIPVQRFRNILCEDEQQKPERRWLEKSSYSLSLTHYFLSRYDSFTVPLEVLMPKIHLSCKRLWHGCVTGGSGHLFAPVHLPLCIPI